MTLEEAIKHCEEVAEKLSEKCTHTQIDAEGMQVYKCAEEHRQLAEWLKDYKRLLEQKPCDDAISRAEAIRVASGYCHWSNIPKELGKLPSVNPIPCEDAISRVAAIDKLDEWDWQEFYLPIHFKELLDDLPSVSVAEKVGEWRHYEGTLICSRCGAEFYDDIMEYCGDDVPKCCPDCGARMVEPQESEDKG